MDFAQNQAQSESTGGLPPEKLEKVLNFQVMAQIEDQQVALEFVRNNGWDQMKALQAYNMRDLQTQHTRSATMPVESNFQENDRLLGFNRHAQPEHYQRQNLDDHMNGISNRDMTMLEQHLAEILARGMPQQAGQMENEEPDPQPGFFSRSFGAIRRFFRSIYHIFIPVRLRGFLPGEQFRAQYEKKYGRKHISFQKDKFMEVFEAARRNNRPVLVIIDTLEDEDFAKNTLANPDLMEIANKNYLVFAGLPNHKDSIDLMEKINSTSLPIIAAATLRGVDKIKVFDLLQSSEQCTYESVMEFLVKGVEDYQKHRVRQREVDLRRRQNRPMSGIVHYTNPVRADNLYEYLRDQDPQITQTERSRIMEERSVREMQKQELEEAKRLDQERAMMRQIKEQEEKERREKEEEERREKEKQKEQQIIRKQSLKEAIKPEPDAGTPDATLIVFRMPNGNRMQRRFMKFDTVEDVYNFLHVSEIEFEDDEGDPDFELLQPMPKKVFAKSEMTLEEAGLHPKAILQVKEI